MKLYRLYSKQALAIDRKTAWDFLSDPKNLSVITPGHMGFHILSGADRPMFSGQIIQYRVSPFPFYSIKWVTEITHVKASEYFVDEQRFGPYALWHHKHFIKDVEGGIEMEDLIDYKLPFGVLGQMAHQLFVKKQLREIFLYREQKLGQLFGEIKGNSKSLAIT
ncbi:SRPBCC family protein [Pseudozobellia thermophila]|uniref:Ligand-binding SRPBCC domain-containing protein n=1 Tax=Pseudozobellia thermophila TaxID=192903 RepID=A0A1M6LH46_9FLAO|nr:SRPBCC family protein [Pseudozobellia thermophila]SHJ70516.1 Ligand-binding SRPBCC domain-containing protein [Pseudozobellia thermophila]